MIHNNDKRLILVSNRLPFQLLKKEDTITLKQSDGGLVSALKSYFEKEKSSVFSERIWIGSADFPELRWKNYKKQEKTDNQFSVEPVFIDPKIYSKYYNGF